MSKTILASLITTMFLASGNGCPAITMSGRCVPLFERNHIKKPPIAYQIQHTPQTQKQPKSLAHRKHKATTINSA